MAVSTKPLSLLLAVAAATFVAAPAAQAQSTKFPVEAGSWGGKVRTGPGSSFKQVAGLKEGDTVTILEDTGVKMNGFPWFKIEFGDGKTGYKWGGVLCSRQTAVKGTFRQCEGFVAVEQAEPAEAEPAKKAEPAEEPKVAADDTAAAEAKDEDQPRVITVVPDATEEAKPDDQTQVAADNTPPAKPEAEPEQKANDDQGMKWAYAKFKDDNNKGRTASTLTFGVPETDNVLLQGYCAEGFKGNVSVLRLGSETGDLADSTEVKVVFSADNKSHPFDGTVISPSSEESITGARITVKNDDSLWETLQEVSDVDYQVNQFKSVSVSLADANEAVGSFLADCASYAGKFDEEPSAATVAEDPPATPKPLNDKEAFDSAKELDTLEAWQAYLRNFPEGFRSDLARAYVKRLKGGDTAEAEPTEETVNLGPGRASWRPFKYKQDEGNASSPAAAVEANGLEFLAYCGANKRVSTILREKKQGVYPDFSGRVERGLKAIEANGSSVPLSFDTGSNHSVPATVFGLTGEVAIGDTAKGFSGKGRFVRDLMSANQFTVSAPPFAASFQLKGSRRALCSMLKSCDVKSADCARYEAPKTVNIKPRVREQPPRRERRRSRCPRRYVWLEGECVHRRFVAEYCGPGYHRRGSRCVRRRYRAPSYDACPPGFFLEFGRCVPF
ncbi:MAG: SH3 domain-containing protein [Alphaproteobacteria bacterium]|nr:SH3 domain-containing protein [Alphaproteobacteria bacterium]